MSDTVPDPVADRLRNERITAHLATCNAGDPHVAPVWYRYDEGTIEIVTTGQKLENIRENPRVALSIQRETDGHPEWAITVRGTASVIDDETKTQEANRRINQKYGAEPDAWAENTLVRIDIGSVTTRES